MASERTVERVDEARVASVVRVVSVANVAKRVESDVASERAWTIRCGG